MAGVPGQECLWQECLCPCARAGVPGGVPSEVRERGVHMREDSRGFWGTRVRIGGTACASQNAPVPRVPLALCNFPYAMASAADCRVPLCPAPRCLCACPPPLCLVFHIRAIRPIYKLVPEYYMLTIAF